MEKLIWKYIDGNCTSQEKSKFEQLLKNDKILANQYQQCLELNNSLENITPQITDDSFTGVLMNRIEQEKLSSQSIAVKPIFSKQFYLFSILGACIMLVGALFIQVNSQSNEIIYDFNINIPELPNQVYFILITLSILAATDLMMFRKLKPSL